MANNNRDLDRRRFLGGMAMAAGAAAAAAAQPAATRDVTINNVRLTDAQLAEFERIHAVRIADANYWYDPVLGAWGVKGSPVLGFIGPSLPLPGPVPADASGRGTGVHVNGRELHPLDLAALQRITGPIQPGRYFITAAGLAGYEGGPAQWNLAAMAAQAGANPTNTWQSRVLGSSGFSDGSTSAVFLPNGGIVSTGP
jgi:hypothetical protein